LHRKPARAWTVASLASAVGMSRSPFAARFTALVGDAPLAYLTRWRMHLAAGDVLDGGSTIREIAERVGYEAEASFSKAFKRQFGMSPRAYRNKYAAKDDVP
jgi:AraC-like DNA-binding protein